MVKSLSKKHPENLEDIKSLKITGEIQEFVKDLNSDIEEEKNELQKLDTDIMRLDRLRYGFRKRKVHPWPDAANYSLPVIDSDINKMKPAYVNVAYGVNPIVTFEPYGPEDVDNARNREYLFDWRMRTQVKFFEQYCYGIDMILGSPGQTIYRTIWDFTTRKYSETIDIEELSEEEVEAIFDARVTDQMLAEIIVERLGVNINFDENIEEVKKAVQSFRDGKQKFDFNLLEIENDQPCVTALHPTRDLTVPIGTKHIQDARFVDYHNLWKSKNEILIAMRDGKYESYSEDDLDAWGGSTDDKRYSDDMIQLHETCCWYDVDGDGIKEKCIVTWPEADPTKVLRMIELPYDHGEWPYVQVKREYTESWFYSTRGVPSLKEDYQVGMSTAVNQAVDNGTLMNTPERVAKKGILSNPRNRKYIPGELTEINGDINQYQTRQLGNASQGILFQQAQYLKSWSDSTTGGQTSGLGAQTDLPGSGERGKKTKAEIDAIVANMSESKSLDLMVFQWQMADVYYQIDALYDQFGSDEETIQITGQEPLELTREQIQGKFNIVPNGRLTNSNPSIRLKQAMFAFNIGFQNPMINQRELIEEVFKELDPRKASILVKSAEQMQQEQQQAAQAQLQAEQEQIQKTLSLRKLSDDMDIRKTAIETPIQGRKHAPN